MTPALVIYTNHFVGNVFEVPEPKTLKQMRFGARCKS